MFFLLMPYPMLSLVGFPAMFFDAKLVVFVSSLLGEILYTSFRKFSVEDCPEPRYLLESNSNTCSSWLAFIRLHAHSLTLCQWLA